MIRVLCLFLFIGVSGCALSSDKLDKKYSCLMVENKHEVLAILLSGKWMENEYYSREQYSSLAIILFSSPSVVSDYSFVDKVVDPDQLTVLRTHNYMLSGKSSEEKVVLSEKEFWRRVIYIDKYIEEHKFPPVTAVDLMMLDAWWNENMKNLVPSKSCDEARS